MIIIWFDDTFSFIENIDRKYQFQGIYISLGSKLEWAGGADRVDALILQEFQYWLRPHYTEGGKHNNPNPIRCIPWFKLVANAVLLVGLI